jgi:1-acyl-sn-glycerol-3-phosphate acyltransferase
MPCVARIFGEVPGPDCLGMGRRTFYVVEMIDTGKDTWFVRLLRAAFYIAMRIFFRIEHRGWERIPANGPLLIIANHVTYFDPFWIGVRVYRTLRFMAWDKIFRFPLSGRLFRWL